MRLKIDWATLIVGRKFTVFALFYFVFEGNFPSTSPRGAYIWRGDLTEGFLRYRFGGLIFGGAYTWRSLFSEFYGIFYFLSFPMIRLCTGYPVHNNQTSAGSLFARPRWKKTEINKSTKTRKAPGYS